MHENTLITHFLDRAQTIKNLKIYGITDPTRLEERVSTFGMGIDGYTPQDLTAHLSKHHIYTPSGHFYAIGVSKALGLMDSGGFLRAGCLHYNTTADLDRLFDALDAL